MSALVALKNIPNLDSAKEDVVALGSDYWTPDNVGEYKRGFILGIESQSHERTEEDNTGEITMIDLPCVVFAEQTSDGFKQWSNGSKRLVAIVTDSIKSGAIKCGETPVQIKYAGKRKNKTNSFKSDSWDLRVLIIPSAAQ